MDIFETLKEKVNCMYISDLKFSPYRNAAIALLRKMSINNKQKSDIYKYLGMVI